MVLRLLDLSSLASVRRCAREIQEEESRLDLLICNAGVMMCGADPKTEDGFDMQIGTNHLGHYLFTRLLVPLMKKTVQIGGAPRVISIASFGHEYATEPMRCHDLNYSEPGSFKPQKAYFQSKV